MWISFLWRGETFHLRSRTHNSMLVSLSFTNKGSRVCLPFWSLTTIEEQEQTQQKSGWLNRNRILMSQGFTSILDTRRSTRVWIFLKKWYITVSFYEMTIKDDMMSSIHQMSTLTLDFKTICYVNLSSILKVIPANIFWWYHMSNRISSSTFISLNKILSLNFSAFLMIKCVFEDNTLNHLFRRCVVGTWKTLNIHVIDIWFFY